MSGSNKEYWRISSDFYEKKEKKENEITGSR